MKRVLHGFDGNGASRVTSVGPARVLLVDCPWQFRDSLPGKSRGAAKNYACMSERELCFFKLPPLADDCLLLFWRVASMQREAFTVITAWGFTVKSEIVWRKLTATGKLHFGLGRYTRASHEVCLLATRGRVKVADRAVRSVFDAPVPTENGKKVHSRKPDAIYEIAERLVPGGPFVEMFARRRRAGWQCYGNELSEAAE